MPRARLRDQLVDAAGRPSGGIADLRRNDRRRGKRSGAGDQRGATDGDALGHEQRLGPVSYKMSDDDPFLGREIHQQRQFSEHTMEVIDQEVSAILQKASEKAFNLLKERREELENLAKALLDREELNSKEIAELIGPSVHQAAIQAKQGDNGEKQHDHAETPAENSASVSHGSSNDA